MVNNDTRLNAAQAVAAQAIRMAADFRVPPNPAIFEVLFQHAAGGNSALSRDVYPAAALPVAEREAALLQVHGRHFGAEGLVATLEEVRASLSSEIAGVVARLGDGVKGNQRMAGELRRSLRDLAEVITKEEVQTLARHLALSGREHLSETQTVSRQLERVQHDLGRMHAELVELRETAHRDHLTGLPNRRHLEDRLAVLAETGTPFCLAMIDLDGFKTVNDSWGHSVGDNILRGAAKVLGQNIKGRDFAARYGGDEFALLLPDTPLAGAVRVCEAIRHAFADIHWVRQLTDQKIGALTLSAGVTERRTGDDPAALIARADALLYEAKAAGRNTVVQGP